MIRLERLTKIFKRQGLTRAIVRGVSFDLPDVAGLALIGRNGAGKSTLLRLIAGTLKPDGGRVVTNEMISWPMGFSGGFHPALTGAQNAKFIARIYGRDPAEMSAFVARFAELGQAFRQPVQTYSSGMKARLAFAASIGVDFDRYLVDEVIGVGDAAFRAKCQTAFRQRMGRSKLIMVSHNPDTLRTFCQSGLVLEAGQLTFYPDLEEALAAYAEHLATRTPA